MSGHTMRAAGFQELGKDAVATLLKAPMPEPGPGEVRVAVNYSVINPADLLLKSGAAKALFADAPPPHWGGLEFSGIVDAVGPGVTLAPGSHVAGVSHFAGTGRGAHAEFVVVSEKAVAELPAGMALDTAACVPMTGLTARLAVDALALNPGDRIAIVGAAGSVGAFVVQIAGKDGLHAIAISGAEDTAFLRDLGAATIVGRGDDWVAETLRQAPGGVRGLVDCALIGDGCLPAIADNGRMVALRGSHLPKEPGRGINTQAISVRDYYGESAKLAELLSLAASGPSPRIAATFDAEAIDLAYRAAEDRRAKGRVLIRF